MIRVSDEMMHMRAPRICRNPIFMAALSAVVCLSGAVSASHRVKINSVTPWPFPRIAATCPAGAVTEAPACSVTYTNGTKYFLTGGWCYSTNLSSGSILTNPAAWSGSKYYSTHSETFNCGEAVTTNYYWRRVYYGVFSANLLDYPGTSNPCIVAIQHGENSNLTGWCGGTPSYWDNTVQYDANPDPHYPQWDTANAYFGERDGDGIYHIVFQTLDQGFNIFLRP